MDTDDILSLISEWDAEYCMDMPSTFHMRESYVLNSEIHNTYTPTYMEALSGEHADEYYKDVDDEIQSLMIRDTLDVYFKEVSCQSQRASRNIFLQVQEET